MGDYGELPEHRRHRCEILWLVMSMKTGLWAGVAMALLASGDARADWPMARQNRQRTAVASGVSNMDEPVPFWRYFAGGTILSQQAMLVDVDGSGGGELIMCSGGKVIAKRPDNQTVWENSTTFCSELVAVVDLDGDGTRELVTRSIGQAYVLRLSDGAVQWAEPVGEMGTIAALRIGNLDVDELPELVVQECGCCSVNSGNSGYGYKFRWDSTDSYYAKMDKNAIYLHAVVHSASVCVQVLSSTARVVTRRRSGLSIAG